MTAVDTIIFPVTDLRPPRASSRRCSARSRTPTSPTTSATTSTGRSSPSTRTATARGSRAACPSGTSTTSRPRARPRGRGRHRRPAAHGRGRRPSHDRDRRRRRQPVRPHAGLIAVRRISRYAVRWAPSPPGGIPASGRGRRPNLAVRQRIGVTGGTETVDVRPSARSVPERVSPSGGVALLGGCGHDGDRCKRLQRIIPRSTGTHLSAPNDSTTRRRRRPVATTPRQRPQRTAPARRPRASDSPVTAAPSQPQPRLPPGRDDLLRRRAGGRLDRHRLAGPAGRAVVSEAPARRCSTRSSPPLRAAGRRAQPRRAPPRGLRAGAPGAHRSLLLRAAHGLRDPCRRARPERHPAARGRQERPPAGRRPTWPPGSTPSPCSALLPCRRPSLAPSGVANPSSSSPVAPEDVRRSTASSSSRPRTPTAPSSSPRTCSTTAAPRLLFVGDPDAGPRHPRAVCRLRRRAHRPRPRRRPSRSGCPFREREGAAVADRIMAGELEADALVCATTSSPCRS